MNYSVNLSWRRRGGNSKEWVLLCRRGTGFFRLVCFFQLQVGVDDLRNVILSDFHVPEPLGPDHHIRAKCTDVQAAASDHANFPFEVAFFGDFPELFDDLFGAAEAAGGAFTVTIIDADVNLSDIRLWSFYHAVSL